MIQEESKIDGALGTQEMAKRVVFKQVWGMGSRGHAEGLC